MRDKGMSSLSVVYVVRESDVGLESARGTAGRVAILAQDGELADRLLREFPVIPGPTLGEESLTVARRLIFWATLPWRLRRLLLNAGATHVYLPVVLRPYGLALGAGAALAGVRASFGLPSRS